MTEEEALANAEARRGKRPEASFGFEFGPLAFPPNLHQIRRDEARQYREWESGARAPVPTVGQFEDATRLPGETASLPNQYRTDTRLEGSSVPHYDTQYQEGPSLGPGPSRPRTDREVLDGLNPQGSNFLDLSRKPITEDYQGPGAPTLQPPSMRNAPQPQLKANYQGVTGSLDRPPSRGPLQPQVGPPQEISRTSLNREAPINTAQEDLYKASLHRQSSPYFDRPMGGGAGAATYRARVEGLTQSLMHDNPGMTLEDAMSQAHRSVNRHDLQQEEIENKKSLIINRKERAGRETLKLAYSKEYQDARIAHMKFLEQQVRDAAANHMSPQDIAKMKIAETHQFHQMVVRAWIAKNMPGIPPEEMQDIERNMIGYLTDTELTLNIEPQTQYDVPGLGKTKVPFTGGTKSYTPSPQNRKNPPLGATPFPQETSQFSDAPPGNAVGDTLKSDGKPVARWDGRTWQPIR